MILLLTAERLRLLSHRLRERLWFRPLLFCLLSIGAAFVAKLADRSPIGDAAPSVSLESIEALLSILSASMLVISTFAVGSMISAYASASNGATPRSFSLVLADDVSQNALSTFIGAFIFSIVALTAVKNDFFEAGGLLTLFVLTAGVFAMVIFTFVRWVDRIARLGRLGWTIEKVEQAATAALIRRRDAPHLGGIPRETPPDGGVPVHSQRVGYLEHIDIGELHAWAESAAARIVVEALPGTFLTPGRPLALLFPDSGSEAPEDLEPVRKAFTVGQERRFQDDPRFGVVVLAEIAGRALSPAVNDPGTAIGILGSMVRLFALWCEPPAEKPDAPVFDRVQVPPLSVSDLFDDAFTAIARDGAASVEVGIRLQKTFGALASLGGDSMRAAARAHARLALERAKLALTLEADLEAVRAAAGFDETATMETRL